MHELRVYYGGTFDPVHNGHLAIARAARDALAVDIRFVPAADPPHRLPPGAGAGDRAAMVQLAIGGSPGLLLDRRELDRGGASWTIDTLHALRAEFGCDTPIAWLVGADSFLSLPTWRRWRELFDFAHFVVAERSGSALDARLAPELAELANERWADDPAALRQRPSGRVLRLRQPLQVHSASDLRRRIAEGLPWRHLLAPAVADYIVEHRLYGAAEQPAVIGP